MCKTLHREVIVSGLHRNSVFAVLAAVGFASLMRTAPAQTMTAPDITKEPTLYVVPYAHLDTQWRSEFPQVISG